MAVCQQMFGCPAANVVITYNIRLPKRQCLTIFLPFIMAAWIYENLDVSLQCHSGGQCNESHCFRLFWSLFFKPNISFCLAVCVTGTGGLQYAFIYHILKFHHPTMPRSKLGNEQKMPHNYQEFSWLYANCKIHINPNLR